MSSDRKKRLRPWSSYDCCTSFWPTTIPSLRFRNSSASTVCFARIKDSSPSAWDKPNKPWHSIISDRKIFMIIVIYLLSEESEFICASLRNERWLLAFWFLFCTVFLVLNKHSTVQDQAYGY